MQAIRIRQVALRRRPRPAAFACAVLWVLSICPPLFGQVGDDTASGKKATASQKEAAVRRMRAALEEVERQKSIMEEQRAIAEQQRQHAEQALARQHAERAEQSQHAAMLQAELQRAQAQLAELTARQQAVQADPLPENAELRVFHMRHVKPHNLAEVLAGILRNNMPRIAVDERSNALLVAGNEQQISIVEQLAETLDRPAAESDMQKPSETLQLRIVWLLDGDYGMEPTDKLVSPHVTEALHELGFASPRVVCQQVTTLTLGEDGGRRGSFNFAVPVLIKSQMWQLEGQGQIESMPNERFNLQFEVRFQQREPTGKGGFTRMNEGQLGGSIYTPLDHYTVMGTTTFVANTSGEKSTPTQHLSAFVVYLDRAKEFPATHPAPQDATDPHR